MSAHGRGPEASWRRGRAAWPSSVLVRLRRRPGSDVVAYTVLSRMKEFGGDVGLVLLPLMNAITLRPVSRSTALVNSVSIVFWKR